MLILLLFVVLYGTAFAIVTLPGLWVVRVTARRRSWVLPRGLDVDDRLRDQLLWAVAVSAVSFVGALVWDMASRGRGVDVAWRTAVFFSIIILGGASFTVLVDRLLHLSTRRDVDDEDRT